MRLTVIFLSIVAIVLFLLLAFPDVAGAGANACATLLAACGSDTKTTPATCNALETEPWCEALDPDMNTQLAPLRSWVAVYVGRSLLLSLAGVDFGIDYDPAVLRSPIWTHCGSLEVQGDGWPAPGTGNTVVWTSPQSGEVVLVGYFTVLKYAGYEVSAYDFTLGAHPTWGTARAYDGASQFDELRYPAIANLGGGPGWNPTCICDPVGVEPTSWGRVKTLYGN